MAKAFNRTTAVGVTTTVLVGPNPRRVGIVLSPPAANRISVSFGEDAVLDTGVTVMPNASPVILHIDTCGFDVTQQINAIASIATTLSWTELVNP